MKQSQKKRDQVLEHLRLAALGEVDISPAQVSACNNYLKMTAPQNDKGNGKKEQKRRAAKDKSKRFKSAPPPLKMVSRATGK